MLRDACFVVNFVFEANTVHCQAWILKRERNSLYFISEAFGAWGKAAKSLAVSVSIERCRKENEAVISTSARSLPFLQHSPCTIFVLFGSRSVPHSDLPSTYFQ